MCTFLTELCIVRYGAGALWDVWNWSITWATLRAAQHLHQTEALLSGRCQSSYIGWWLCHWMPCLVMSCTITHSCYQINYATFTFISHFVTCLHMAEWVYSGLWIAPRWGLTPWGRVTHICVDDLTIIGSDNGLSPSRRQAIIWTNVGILLIVRLRANFSEILFKIHSFSLKKCISEGRLQNGGHFVSASMY